MQLFADAAYNWNVTVFALEVIALIVAIMMIIVGLLQNKKAQTGLSALNGGNEELFMVTKERGLDRTLSRVMLTLGIVIFVITFLIVMFTNNFIPAS